MERNRAGQIERVVGPQANGDTQAIAYRYDRQGRLILARSVTSTDQGQAYGYLADGSLFSEPVRAHLGAAVNWIDGINPGVWTGTLSGDSALLSYAIRASELVSSVHVPGAAGAIVLAVTSQGVARIEAIGASVLGQSTRNGQTTTLLRVSAAGLKWIRLHGVASAEARVQIRVAGDLNRDGRIDGSDSAAFDAAFNAPTLDPSAALDNADLDGDGQIGVSDRQVLFANYGFRANLAPVATGAGTTLLTHSELSTHIALDAIAHDNEGDSVFWRVLGATHGSARLLGDGQSLLFTPEPGYTGPATVTVQADDGFAASAPIALSVTAKFKEFV